MLRPLQRSNSDFQIHIEGRKSHVSGRPHARHRIDGKRDLLRQRMRNRSEDGEPAFRPKLRQLDPREIPRVARSEEHTSELQSLMRTSYAVFCLTKKIK